MPVDTHWTIPFLGGFLLASAAWFAWLSIVATKHATDRRNLLGIIYEQSSDIETLQAQKTPYYQVGVGVDPVARRNPVVEPAVSGPVEIDDLPVLHVIGEHEDDVWDFQTGGYRQ